MVWLPHGNATAGKCECSQPRPPRHFACRSRGVELQARKESPVARPTLVAALPLCPSHTRSTRVHTRSTRIAHGSGVVACYYFACYYSACYYCATSGQRYDFHKYSSQPGPSLLSSGERQHAAYLGHVQVEIFASPIGRPRMRLASDLTLPGTTDLAL